MFSGWGIDAMFLLRWLCIAVVVRECNIIFDDSSDFCCAQRVVAV